MSYEDYSNALKAGQKEYRSRVQEGSYPYLPVLDEILSYVDVSHEVSLGLCEVPMEQIVGTKSKGRNNAFAANFLPLLKPRTEFAAKWIDLYDSLQEEGLRDPIKAYEFMNRFYVLEGNKRVSVLKYLDAYSIPCNVIRVVPKRNEASKENRIYYEFLDFYAITGINYIQFSEEGRYEKLLELTSSKEGEKWTLDECRDFNSVYSRFSKAFFSKGGKKLSITTGDAFLAFLMVFGYADAQEKMVKEIQQDLTKIWDEFVVLTEEHSVELNMEPDEETDAPKKSFLDFILPDSTPKKLKIAFLYEKTAKESSWSYSHELGRLYLETVFPGRVETVVYDNVIPSGSEGENDADIMQKAIEDGCTVIFATSPPMLPTCLKMAANNPDIIILDCSLHTSHPMIRTYYARMYEGKFLAGAIAGALTQTDRIGYIANYPIYGMTANINAFALGAKMVNPHTKIYLDWTTLKEPELTITKDPKINYIMDQDMVTPNSNTRHFGLYRTHGLNPENIAMPAWDWGKLYEKIVRTILNGAWKSETPETTRAINYWWGMSSGVIDLICSQNLPNGTKRLVELLKADICSGDFSIFSGIFHAQDGTQMCDNEHTLSPEEIITMNWLLDNVEGFIPTIDQLSEEAQAVTKMQGIEPEE